jgi:biopolymer transport protein ExbB
MWRLRLRGPNNTNPKRQRARAVLAACLASLGLVLGPWPLLAQQPAGPLTPEAAERVAEERLAAEEAPASDEAPAPDEARAAAPATEPPRIDFLHLMFQGGPLMVPIAGMSILVIAFGIERALGLRRRKVVPPGLIEELAELTGKQGGLDPRKAYHACQRHPSAASNVIRAALLKVGRPHSEVEHAVHQASEREAAKLYANVRPILLGISVAPLLGLLGTVQGMIEAFFITASGTVSTNKAEALAHGIYVALVTTLAGLSVAIPAALIAHYFEGRIQALFREIDEQLLNMLPLLERYEGKLRVSRVERSSEGSGIGLEKSPRRPREASGEVAQPVQPARASE